ncbi:MAG: lipoprotein-releasing system transmembrane subunit LolC [Gammaproteobacteria bacterium]|nr:lipoprotein-releasing system transmembrane subunit LolC [Gammaproteobacteria bacterium]|tara:strand:- start:2165 stop:3400 length:1236 start_codon:yes stop_codon:yes gene_type:complete
MFKPFSLFVGMRYSLTRKRNFFLSFVSLISMLGVSLGVMILIVALSVINGSITTLREEALKSVPHVTIGGEPLLGDWQQLLDIARRSEKVLAAVPFLEGEAALRYQGRNSFIRLRGVDPAMEAEVVNNGGRLYSELLALLEQTDNGIILGTQLAGALGIYSNAEVSINALGSLLARSLSDEQGFQVLGFADFGVYGNNDVTLVNLNRAQVLFEKDSGVSTQLRLKVEDVFQAESIATDLFGAMDGVEIQPWNAAQANLFNALNMEKILTSFMLLMIVVIGAVNIISTLVMVVSDKAADIAILRTMGASRGMILKIFVVQGLIAGILGTLVGAVFGVLLANNITQLSLQVERFIDSLFTDANIYLISHLQTRVDANEVLMVCLAALLISFLATLYPAYRASKIQPAEVLRYE